MEVKPHAWLEIDENVFGVPVYRGVVHWTPDEIAGEHRRVPIFTADQMRSYGESCARRAREQERERVLEIVRRFHTWRDASGRLSPVGEEISAAIRGAE